MIDGNKGLPWFIFIYFFNNSTGKQFWFSKNCFPVELLKKNIFIYLTKLHTVA